MTDLTDRPAVVLRIGKKWRPNMDQDEVYDTVRGWWVMGPKREKCEYAIAVAHGIVRGAFRIDAWQARSGSDSTRKVDASEKPKWGFDGAPAPELQNLLGQDVSDMFKKGSANPVSYLNC